MSAAPGTLIGEYRVISLLGSGGMGEVYLVENQQLMRREAMKIISVAGAGNEDFQQRFVTEARTVAGLDHPGIVTVHGYGVADGQPWFTMSHVDGADLAGTQLSPADAVAVISQASAALDYAHGKGVVHRDIKPANIVVTRHPDGSVDRAVLLDFGIAKLADSPQLTAVNSIIGTVTYTAPEIISGQQASPRSDQYSLACTLYHLFAGHPPFRADTSTALMMAHIQQPPPPLNQVRPDLAPLAPVLLRAMAKDPAARYPDCRSFAADLQLALAHTAAGTATMIGVPTPPVANYGSGSSPAPAYPSGPHSTPGTPAPMSGPAATPQFTGAQPGQPAPAFGAPAFTGPGFNGPGASGPGFNGPGTPPPGQPNWGPPTKKSRRGLWIALSAALVAVIAVAATSPLWWPSGDDGPTGPTVITHQISSSYNTTCAVRDGALFCWGSNAAGQLGDGTTDDRKTPQKVDGLTNVTSVAVGGYDPADSTKVPQTTVCAVADGDAYCWGSNGRGQIDKSDDSDDYVKVPMKIDGLPKISTIASYWGSVCVITKDDLTLWCWGDNDEGHLGFGDDKETNTPRKVPGLTNVTSISMSVAYSCAISAGDLYCWGDNYAGNLGDGTRTPRKSPIKVVGLSDVTQVTTGSTSITPKEADNDMAVSRDTCAISKEVAYCWGSGFKKDKDNRILSPRKVPGLPDVVEIQANVLTGCAITTEKKLMCWGNNSFGQVGTTPDDTGLVSEPRQIVGIKNPAELTVGWSRVCTRTSEQSLYCWGVNEDGLLGNPSAGTSRAQTTPVKIDF